MVFPVPVPLKFRMRYPSCPPFAGSEFFGGAIGFEQLIIKNSKEITVNSDLLTVDNVKDLFLIFCSP